MTKPASGTVRRTALQISEELALLGANLGSGSDLDTSFVTLSTLKEKLDAALDIFDGVDMAAVRAKSLRLSSLFLDLVAEKCAGFGLRAITARDNPQRGSHVALAHADGFAIMQALIRRKVIGDFRAPDVMRFGLTPLYLRYRDVWDAVEGLSQVLRRGEWKSAELGRRTRVT